MGAGKRNPTAITTSGKGRFAPEFRLRCEERLCVDWAVAFGRVTGWPVHLVHVAKEPVRAFCEDDGRWVFDVAGMMPPTSHGTDVVRPLVLGRQWPEAAYIDGPARTRLKTGIACVGEERLHEYCLSPDEALVAECEAAIRANAAYLELVPERPKPWAAARDVSRYSFGGCVVYAEALSRLTGLPAVTMTAVRTRPGIEMRGGGFHDAVVHPDGTLEDIWGRFPVERIAARYGIADWELSPEPHARMVADALRDRPGAEADVEEAMRVVESLRRQC